MNNVYIPSHNKKHQTGKSFVEAEVVITICENYFGITRELLMKKSRRHVIVYPRCVCIWLLDKYSRFNHRGISVLFDQKDVSSVKNAVVAIDNYLSYDEQVKSQIRELEIEIARNKQVN